MRSFCEQLLSALETRDESEFELLIQDHLLEILWMKDKEGKSGLDLIIKYGNKTFFTMVLEELNSEKSKDIPNEALDFLLDRAISLAYYFKQMEIMELALNNPYGLKAKNLNSALTQAVYEDDIQAVKNLMKRGASPNVEGWYFTDEKSAGILSIPLSLALGKESKAMVDFLLKEGAYLIVKSSTLACVDEQRDEVLSLFSPQERVEIDLFLNLARIKMNLFKALSENNYVLFCAALNRAHRDFPKEASKILWARNSAGNTAIEEAFNKKYVEFSQALTHFSELTQGNSRWLPRSEELDLNPEDMALLQEPVNKDDIAFWEIEALNRLRELGAAPSLPGSATNFGELDEDMFGAFVPKPAAEPRSPQSLLFQSANAYGLAPSHPWQGPPVDVNGNQPSAPPLELLQHDEAAEIEDRNKSCILG